MSSLRNSGASSRNSQVGRKSQGERLSGAGKKLEDGKGPTTPPKNIVIPSTPASTLTPDIMFKMCKKIAQLTKVIYYLNSKMEDHGTEVSSLTGLYEEEIDNIIQDAQTKIHVLANDNEESQLQLRGYEEAIKSYLDTIEELKTQVHDSNENQVNITAQMAEIAADKDTAERRIMELERVEDEYRSFQDSHEERCQQYEDQISELMEELNKLRDDQSFLVRESVERYEGIVSELKERKQKEMETMETKHKEKVTKMEEDFQVEKLNLESRINHLEHNMEQVLAEEKAVFQAQIDELNKTLSKTIREYESKLTVQKNEYEDKVSTLEESLTKSRKETIEWKGKYEKTFMEKQEVIKDLQTAKNTIKTHESTIADLEEVKAALTTERDQLQDQLRQADTKISNLYQTIEQNERIQTELKNTIVQLEKEIKNGITERENLQGIIESQNVKIEDLNKTIEENQERLKQMEILQRQIRDLERAMEAAIREHNVKIIELNQQHERALEKALAEQKQQLVNDLTDKHTKAMNEQKEKYEKMISEVTASMEELQRAIQKLKQNHRDEIAGMEQRHKEAFAAMEDRHDIEMQKQQQEAAEAVAILEDKVTGLESNVKELEQDKEDLEKEKTVLEDQIETKSREYQNLEANYQVLENEGLLYQQQAQQELEQIKEEKQRIEESIVTVEKQIRDTLQHEFNQEKENLNSSWKETLRVEVERKAREDEFNYLKEVKILKDEMEEAQANALKLQEETHAKVVEKSNNEKDELQKALKLLQEEKELLLRSIEDLKKEHKEQLFRIREESVTAIEEATRKALSDATQREKQLKVQTMLAIAQADKKHHALMEENNRGHLRQVEQLNKAHALALETLKTELELHKDGVVASLLLKHKEDIEILNQRWKDDLEATIQALKKEHQENVLEIIKRHDEILNVKMTELEVATENIQQLQQTESNLNERIAELNTQICALEDLVAKTKNDLAEAIKNFKLERQDLEDDYKATHKSEVEKINNAHLKELQTMVHEIQQVKGYYQKEISSYQKQLKDAEYKYQHREPRESDVRRIAELEDDLKRRKRRMEVMGEELEYYKLELNNREANFNKMFNKQPIVGVIKPDPRLKQLSGNNQQQTKLRPVGSEANLLSRLPPIFSNNHH